MKYCVKKGTNIVIDGQELATDEIMLRNAMNCGFAKDEIEILTKKEYKNRVNEENKYKVKEPDKYEKLRSDIDFLAMSVGVDL